MNSKQNEAQPWAQAGWFREALRVAGEVGVLHSSYDLWDIITHGEPREGTCVDAMKRSDGVGTAGKFRLPAPKVSWNFNSSSCRAAQAKRKTTLGKPCAGKPPARFDEGREADGHWPSGLSIRRFPPTLPVRLRQSSIQSHPSRHRHLRAPATDHPSGALASASCQRAI